MRMRACSPSPESLPAARASRFHMTLTVAWPVAGLDVGESSALGVRSVDLVLTPERAGQRRRDHKAIGCQLPEDVRISVDVELAPTSKPVEVRDQGELGGGLRWDPRRRRRRRRGVRGAVVWSGGGGRRER